MFLNVWLFQIVWNTGVLYFFPTLVMLTYWQAFVFVFIKNIFGLHPNFGAANETYLIIDGRDLEEINLIKSLTTTLFYFICIALIKLIL